MSDQPIPPQNGGTGIVNSNTLTYSGGNIELKAPASGVYNLPAPGTSLASTSDLSSYLLLSGGTLTGPLNLNANASSLMQAVTLQQLNAAVLGVYKFQGGYKPTVTNL